MSDVSTTSTLILVADDDPASRELARAFLENSGYRVVLANDGAQALKLAREHLPALALLDIRMRGLDGFEVCEQLRSEPATSAMKLALLSAQDRPSDLLLARQRGADTLISKMLGWSGILKRVQELLQA